MTHAAPSPSTGDTSPAALWDAARYVLRWLVSLFGEPVEVAGLGVLAPRERGEMLGWLRPLEALLRALLVIKAAALPAPEERARSGRTSRRRSRKMVAQDPDCSESWRVSFRALPPKPGLPSERREPSADLPSAWPIAERLEAIIRVLENPEPFARRLAARLRARPDDTVRALRPPPNSPRQRPGDWALSQAREQALGLVSAFDTS